MTIDFIDVKDIETFYKAFDKAELPELYGHNLDALYDVLTTLENTQIIIENASSAYNTIPDYMESFTQMCVDATRVNESIEIIIESE